MYGRSDPKPLPPSYSPEDLKKMKRAEEARRPSMVGFAGGPH